MFDLRESGRTAGNYCNAPFLQPAEAGRIKAVPLYKFKSRTVGSASVSDRLLISADILQLSL